MDKTDKRDTKNWLKIAGLTLFVIGILAFLFYNLSSIPPGVSNREISYINSTNSVNELISNPINAPQKILFLLASLLNFDSITIYRSISSFFGLITVLCFYLYIRKYQTLRVSLISTALLASSSWFLHNSRLALPIVLLPLGTIIVLLSARDIIKIEKTKLSSVLSGILIGLSLYIPSVFLIFMTMLIFGLKSKKEKLQLKQLSILLTTALIVIIPLILAIIKNSDLLLTLSGLPNSFMPIEWLKRLVIIPIFLFAKGPFDPLINIGRLPLLDLYSCALVLLGVYAMYFKLREKNIKQIVIAVLFSVLLISLAGIPLLGLILPLIFIVASYGVALILQQWFTIFPKNSLAKNIGVIIFIISLIFVGAYHAKRYFVVWPNTPATQAVFRTQTP